ncbi:hypothetical protein HPG69_000588 [Diceros bicornis minor]|uniref:Acyloxyacyl hydrolase n=1 Tax=Diceros bicornis minor TaxID=77932 RepID=A0A7J7FHZ6_DICBM|nr:hypothetical protein HPG69_000588 [Diceros bicornis minor]
MKEESTMLLALDLTKRILISQQAKELLKMPALGTEPPLFRPYSKPERTATEYREKQKSYLHPAEVALPFHLWLLSLSRNQLLDHPAIVIYAMIGNDVCNGKNDPVPEMTTPKKLYSKVMQTLQYLNSHLPNGSHVILYGLPDGTFLWDNLHSRYHPLGQLNKDVTYAHFYSFLSCVQVSPCLGWMSSNKTLRTLTTERAEQLSNTLKKIATSEKFANFNLFYMDFNFREITEEWKKRGGQPWQLIEPVDGFHPNERKTPHQRHVIDKPEDQTTKNGCG